MNMKDSKGSEKEERRDSSCPSSHDEVRRSFLCRTKSIRPVARQLFLSPYPWGPLELLSPSSSVRYCKEKQSSGKKKRMKYEWIALENQYTSNNSKESLNRPPESCLKRVLYGPLIHSHLFLSFVNSVEHILSSTFLLTLGNINEQVDFVFVLCFRRRRTCNGRDY